jgi:hypothetical protein
MISKAQKAAVFVVVFNYTEYSTAQAGRDDVSDGRYFDLFSHSKQRIAESSFAPSSQTLEFGVLVAVCGLFVVRETTHHTKVPYHTDCSDNR